MLEAVIAAIGYAGGRISAKSVLDKYRVPVKRFIPLLFVWLAIVTAVFLPQWGQINFSQLFELKYIALFFAMIMLAVAWNTMYYEGIQKEPVHEFELIMLLSPMATIIFAQILLPEKTSLSVFVAAIIASLALVFTHVHRKKIEISNVAWHTIIAMLLMSLESIVNKVLLDVMSPVTLYFVRTSVLALVFVALYKPKIMHMAKEAYALTIFTAIMGVVQMVLKFYGFQSLGVVETTLILILGPFLVYFFSAMYLKEKLFKRDILAAAVVASCVLYVTFI